MLPKLVTVLAPVLLGLVIAELDTECSDGYADIRLCLSLHMCKGQKDGVGNSDLGALLVAARDGVRGLQHNTLFTNHWTASEI